MVNEHSFEGRVAVVTGAGRGIGRAYAILLASRGASVVVNDLGGSLDGVGEDAGVAAEVADEIVGAGGAAIADASDVSTPEGGRSLIEAAIERFGRLDILVNNAGIIRWAGLPEADTENLASHLAVHVLGSFNTTRAAWPHMVDQGYGRIVMTTSSGLFGLPKNLSYATAKGGVIGLTRSLATAGAAHGIKVNLIAPGAVTRMAGQAAETGPAGGAASPWMSPDLVRSDGRLPRPRGLPGQRRDLRRRLRAVRPDLHRLDRGVCPPHAGSDHRGRGPALGHHQRRDGVRRACRPHGLVGRLHDPSLPERWRSR